MALLIIAVVLPLAILGLGITIGTMLNQKRLKVYREYGEKLGLQFILRRVFLIFTHAKLAGNYNGLHVEISDFKIGAGDSRVIYTYISTKTGLTKEFQGHIYVKRFFTKIVKTANVQLGDQKFDETFAMKTNDAEQLKAILTPDVRAQLVTLCQLGRIDRAASISIRKGILRLSVSGTLADAHVQNFVLQGLKILQSWKQVQ